MSATSIESILASRRGSSPLVVSAYESLLEQMPHLRKSLGGFVGSQDEMFWSAGEARCHEIVHLASGDAGTFRAAVSAWVDFSIAYLERQNRFLATGRYACTSFDEIARDLYGDGGRMESYLRALMFSFIFSSNYIGFFRFFSREMLPRIGTARTVCDVGCGHGVYLTQMLLAAPDSFGRGLDISEFSLATTEAVLSHHAVPPQRYALERADLRARLPVESRSQDAVTCFEVIEHLEDPAHALGELRRILRPGAPLCVSTAVRMESIDHLYVFSNPEQVRDHLARAGFTVSKDECLPLTTEDVSDPGARQRLVGDPRVSVGYVALAV